MNKCPEKMWTTKISDSNRNILKSMCSKDESFDSAISRLIHMARISDNAAHMIILKKKGVFKDANLATQVNRGDSINGYNSEG